MGNAMRPGDLTLQPFMVAELGAVGVPFLFVGGPKHGEVVTGPFASELRVPVQAGSSADHVVYVRRRLTTGFERTLWVMATPSEPTLDLVFDALAIAAGVAL